MGDYGWTLSFGRACSAVGAAGLRNIAESRGDGPRPVPLRTKQSKRNEKSQSQSVKAPLDHQTALTLPVNGLARETKSGLISPLVAAIERQRLRRHDPATHQFDRDQWRAALAGFNPPCW